MEYEHEKAWLDRSFNKKTTNRDALIFTTIWVGLGLYVIFTS